MDQSTAPSTWTTLGPALIGLAGAVIGSLGSSLTTILITKQQRADHLRKELWTIRRVAYQGLTASLTAASIELLSLVDKLDQRGSSYLSEKEGAEHYQEALDKAVAFRFLIDDAVVVLPSRVLDRVQAHIVEVVGLEKSARAGQLPHPTFARQLFDKTERLRQDLITQMRSEMLDPGEPGFWSRLFGIRRKNPFS